MEQFEKFKRSSEYRQVEFKTETRDGENGKKEHVVRGYPILFNTPTKVWDWYYGEIEEVILPQAMPALIAVSVNLFIVPFSLYNGGIIGLAQLIRSILIEVFKLKVISQSMETTGEESVSQRIPGWKRQEL